MEHKPITSSNIATVGYDPATRTMEVTFKSGSTYAYENVSPEQVTLLKSHGTKYLISAIIPHHTSTKL